MTGTFSLQLPTEKKPDPSMFIVKLRHANPGNGTDSQVYEFISVAYKLEEVHAAAIKTIKKDEPAMDAIAQKRGGWAIFHIQRIPKDKILRLFQQLENGDNHHSNS